MMNNVCMVLLSINMITFALHANDIRVNLDHEKYDENYIDGHIFWINGRTISPYKTEFVKTLSDAYFAVEFNGINSLYVNARERILQKKSVYTFGRDYWVSCKLNTDLIDIDLLSKHTFCIKNIEKTSENPLVMIPEKGLFTLLQYSYGINRTETDTTILLNDKGTEKITVGPLLMKVLDKYRSYERIEQQ